MQLETGSDISVAMSELDAKPIRLLSDDEALLRAQTDFNTAEQHKRDHFTRCERYMHIYKALNPPEEAIDETTGSVSEDIELYSDTYMPMGAAIVDSAVAQLYNLFFSVSDFMEMESDDLEDRLYMKEITAHLMKRTREMKFKHKIYNALQQAVCFDYGVTMTKWKIEDGYVAKTQRVSNTEKVGGIPFTKTRHLVEPIYMPNKVDRSDLTNIDYFNCYHDPSAPDGMIENSAYFIDEREELLETLWMNSNMVSGYGKYQNVDAIIQATIKNDPGLSEHTQTLARNAYIRSRRVKVRRYWTRNHLVEYCGQFLLRRMNICDWPLQFWQCYPVQGQFNAMGLLQRLERLQYDINASMNARRNYQNLVSNPFGVVDESLVGVNDQPSVYPGWFGISRGGIAKDKIWVYQPGQNSNVDALSDVGLQMEMAEKQAHISDPGQGKTSSGRTTATEARHAQAGMASAIESIALRMEESAFESIYLSLFQLEQVNLTREEAFVYNGKYGDEFFVVGPHSYMWHGQPRFRAKGTISVMRDMLEIQQLTGAIDTLLKLEGRVEVDWQELTTHLMRKLTPKHYERFIKDKNIPTEDIPPDIENMLMAQGRAVQVSPANKHQEHIASHMGKTKSPDYQTWPRRQQQEMEIHLQQHQSALAPQPSQQQGPQGQALGAADMLRGAGIGAGGGR